MVLEKNCYFVYKNIIKNSSKNILIDTKKLSQKVYKFYNVHKSSSKNKLVKI